jgi:TRAP-type C4-dicarboxylate transport system permease small subunit
MARKRDQDLTCGGVATSWLVKIEQLCFHIARAALLLIMLTIVANALMRYLFSRPIAGAENVTELYLIVAVVFLAGAKTQRDGENVSVTVFTGGKQGRKWTAVKAVGLLFSLALVVAMTYASTVRAIDNLTDVTTGVPPLPLLPSWVWIPIGLGLLALRLLLQLVETLAAGSKVPETQARMEKG